MTALKYNRATRAGSAITSIAVTLRLDTTKAITEKGAVPDEDLLVAVTVRSNPQTSDGLAFLTYQTARDD